MNDFKVFVWMCLIQFVFMVEVAAVTAIIKAVWTGEWK